MSDLTLIYFLGCPNSEKAKALLVDAGATFKEIIQDNLTPSHPLKRFSSPTLLRGRDILFGTETGVDGGCSLSIPNAAALEAILSPSVKSEKKMLLVAPTGSLGSIITVLLCPVCKPAIAVFLASIGLGFVVREEVMKSLLVTFLFLSVAGLFWSYLKVHRNIWPTIAGALMSVGLYLGQYVYFGSMENLILVWGSIVGLVVVSGWNIFLRRRGPACAGNCVS